MTTCGLRAGAVVVVAVLAVLAVVVAPAGAASLAGAERSAASGHTPDAACGGTGGGAAYATDSGLTVFENDSDVTHGTFPDNQTVDFGSILFSASGAASARLENGTGTTTCVAAVNATATDVLLAPAGENNVTVAGNLTDLWFEEVDYAPGDGTADVAYGAPEPTDLRFEDTGLSPGTTVFAEATNGTRLDTATVADDGSVTVSLPAETHTVDVRRAQPATFTVTIDSTTAPVEAGTPLTVTATVENTGEVEGTRTVTLTVGGEQSDAREVTLGGGDQLTVELTWPTEAGDAGDHTATVDTGDDSDATAVTVQGDGGDGVTFVVTIDDVAVPDAEGGSLDVTATIENTGNATDTQTVTLTVDGIERDSRELTLDGGEAQSVTFSWEEPDDIQEPTLEVSSEDDFDVSSVQVDGGDEDEGVVSLGAGVLFSPESAAFLLLLLLALVLAYYYARRRRAQD